MRDNLTNKLCVGWTPSRCKILITNDCRGCKFFKTIQEVQNDKIKVTDRLTKIGKLGEYSKKYNGGR